MGLGLAMMISNGKWSLAVVTYQQQEHLKIVEQGHVLSYYRSDAMIEIDRPWPSLAKPCAMTLGSSAIRKVRRHFLQGY
jgi:hypothetical protein